MDKLLENFSTLVVFFLCGLLLLSCSTTYFGWHTDAVLSGSMEPTLPVGGVVVIRPVDASQIEVGNIIAYSLPGKEKLTVHRVISIEYAPEKLFHTKGDANEEPDIYAVPAKDIVGKVCFCVPYLGYFSHFVRTPVGFTLTLCIPLLLLLTWPKGTRKDTPEKKIEN
ncbi:MAG: hypothetical protein QG610_710 [Euryarchaeota archaeon]|nr:hypothetical protein [Euryarchaeota archaeon]